VGATKGRSIDVRVIAATARDLAEEVSQGRFREDLYYRLNVLAIHIPPLRERPEDISLLASHLLKRINRKLHTQVTSISSPAMAMLLHYSWPGNVRELENVIERAVIMADQDAITIDNLPPNLTGRQENRRLMDFFGTLSLKNAGEIMEKNLIGRALDVTGGNKSRAAEILEISYPSLLSKIKKYNLE
jgi:two-component system, NtrC family, response regulator AtoC